MIFVIWIEAVWAQITWIDLLVSWYLKRLTYSRRMGLPKFGSWSGSSQRILKGLNKGIHPIEGTPRAWSLFLEDMYGIFREVVFSL